MLFAVPKPGTCPVPEFVPSCIQRIDECQADTDCPNRQKCCLVDSCSNTCADPEIGMNLHYFYITYSSPINKVKYIGILKLYVSQYKI